MNSQFLGLLLHNLKVSVLEIHYILFWVKAWILLKEMGHRPQCTTSSTNVRHRWSKMYFLVTFEMQCEVRFSLKLIYKILVSLKNITHDGRGNQWKHLHINYRKWITTVKVFAMFLFWRPVPLKKEIDTHTIRDSDIRRKTEIISPSPNYTVFTLNWSSTWCCLHFETPYLTNDSSMNTRQHLLL